MVRLTVDPKSYWADLPSSFDRLGEQVSNIERRTANPRAVVIGCSDGKFAVPLAQRGWDVTGIDTDPTFLYGGHITLRTGRRPIQGLLPRLRELGIEDRCRVVETDYMHWDEPGRYDMSIISGLWCMPVNRVYPLADLVGRQQDMVSPGGIFFADYLIATNDEERDTDHCPDPAEVAALFPGTDWVVESNDDLGLHTESHLGWEDLHTHRYGAVIARRRSLDAQH